MAATQAARDRVAAGAAGGTAAVNAYDQGQQAIKASRGQAINAMDAEARQFGAPGALIGQLNAGIAQPANTALGNLGMLGSVAENASQSEDQAANVYKLEAAQALPVIQAQDNSDLARQLEMLSAQRAHSGGGKVPKYAGSPFQGMSDSEIRNRLIGMAIANREGSLQQAQQAFANQMNAQPETPTPVPFTQAQLSNLGPAGPAQDRLMAMHMARENAIHGTIQGIDEPIKKVYFTFRNKMYGPGLSNEAAALGMQYGLDPATALGVTANADSAYVGENTREGLYTPPGKSVATTDQTLDPYRAGAQGLPAPPGQKPEQLTKQQVDQSLHQQYFDWNNDSRLQGTFAAWAKQKAALDPQFQNMPITQQQQLFEQDPASARFRKPVVWDIVGSLQSAAKNGYDVNTAWNMLQTDPAFQSYPREFGLALNIASPLFAYYAALRTKMTSPDAANAAALAPTGSYDPTAATNTGY